MAKPTKFGKKWRIRWIDENGEQRSGGVFETFREAEAELKLLEAKVEEIKRGLRSPTPGDRTFSELCDYWLTKGAAHKRSLDDDRSIIKCHLRPSFGHLMIRDVGRCDLAIWRWGIEPSSCKIV